MTTTTALLTHLHIPLLDSNQSLHDASPAASHVGGGVVRAGLKRRNSRAMRGRDGRDRHGDAANLSSDSPTPQPWVRKMSSVVSRSRDSSRTSNSRPGSSTVSYSNGSIAFSHNGSTAPIMSENTPPTLPPNKLIKRSASLRSGTNSPTQQSPGSRLPLPVFRRPATSHERSATLQEQLLRPQSQGGRPHSENEGEWRHYWTRKMAAGDLLSGRRRHSTGIPNPIKRVYPDRKYTPVLVSARDNIRQSNVEVDDTASVDSSEGALPAQFNSPTAVISSPLTRKADLTLGPSPTHSRSFSITDILSTGPKQMLRKSSLSKRSTPPSKLSKSARRTVSAPLSAMGGILSSRSGDEPERPSKRRETINSRISQQSIYASDNSQHDAVTPSTSALPLETASPQPSPDESSFHGSSIHRRTPSPIDHQATNQTSTSWQRPSRVSNAVSEDPSTVGSESERRSLGAYSTDYGDNAWDSYPTRTTRSSSGRRGPPIDAIFDDSPPTFPSAKSTKLKDLLSDGSQMSSSHGLRLRHSTIQEEGSVTSTPPRTSHEHQFPSSPSARMGPQQLIPSSPPMMPDPDDMDWDVSDSDEPMGDATDEAEYGGPPTPLAKPSSFGDKMLPFRLSPFARSQAGTSRSAASTPRRNGATGGPLERPSIFDWSEQQPSPAHPGNSSPPRPKTVHGKKEPDTRGSRSTGRRAPSGMHARSHSVPVAPDAEGKRSNVVANKFGTWGVGSKGVTEDWNEDFEFDEVDLPAQVEMSPSGDKRIDSGHEMFVPRSIREQQENVVANIGLLREWGLLIEELKELRIRAGTLNMLKGPHEQSWSEVDAMIELADQESEENTLEPRYSPPSSPGFDFDAFDEPAAAVSNTGLSNPISDSHIQAPQLQKAVALAEPAIASSSNMVTRPRKDSEAIARSVIEALQTKRSSTPESSGSSGRGSSNSKVPFDTATLRHIVPYVHGLKRKVKDALREAEGLYSSPRRRRSPNPGTPGHRDNEAPSFQTIFSEPHVESSPLVLPKDRARRHVTKSDHGAFEEVSSAQQDELSQRLDSMSIARDPEARQNG